MRWLVAALALGLLVFAGWRAYTLALAAFWSEARPAEALRLRPALPKAVYANAEREFHAPRRGSGVTAGVKDALRISPLDGRGYRYLGAGAEAAGDAARAEALYRIAETRGPRDLPTAAWMGDLALKQGNYADALARLDRIMRIQPERMHRLNPVLNQLAELPAAQRAFAKLLASNPPWRPYVLTRVLGTTDSARIFPMVEELRTRGGGLEPAELKAWLDRLAAAQEWGAAYLTWVQSLSPEASSQIGNVYNGGFEHEPSNSGFDWRFDSVAGAHVTRAQATGIKGNNALRVGFEDQRVPFAHVRQLMALAPGHYRFSGRVRLDDLRTDRGLVWTIACAGNVVELAQTAPLTGRKDWTTVEAEFEVPVDKCGGQWLTLKLPARIPAEQRIGGVAWFDDLKIKSVQSSSIH